MTNEIDLILDKVLNTLGREFIDGDLVETLESFEKFLVLLATTVFPDHEISNPEPGTIVGNAAWSFTINTTDIFEEMKPFSPGLNRDAIVRVLGRQLARRDTISDLQGKSPVDAFDVDKLVLVPKMGSFIRQSNVLLGRPAYNYVYSAPAINETRHLMYVPRHALSHIGLSEDELFERAMQNIRKSAEGVSVEFEDGIGFIESDVMDGMAAQLIFYPEFWKSLSEKVGDHLFIHAVEHDELIVCKASERDTIFGIVASAATGKVESLLPGTFFTYDDEGFRLFAKRLPDDA
jgi:hypothetical protein